MNSNLDTLVMTLRKIMKSSTTKKEMEKNYSTDQKYRQAKIQTLREANRACKEVFHDTIAFELNFSEHMCMGHCFSMGVDI